MFRASLTARLMLTASFSWGQDRTPLHEFLERFPLELEKETRKADNNELFIGDPS